MDDHTSTGLAGGQEAARDPCTTPFLLCELVEGGKDRLGHEVEEILWMGRNYTIYRSEKGVDVQFADTPSEEATQRCRFTGISPELCELRYLTNEMRAGWFSAIASRTGHLPSELYDHNMAQAVMLVMEDKVLEGKQLAQQALKMAVDRVTNDNMIRYLECCVITLMLYFAAGALYFAVGPHPQPHLHLPDPQSWKIPLLGQPIYVVAAMAGATGAVLSVATRLQAFQFKPCHQSNMNYLMSITRVSVGLVAGPILLLLGFTILETPIKSLVPAMAEPHGAALLGLIAGFAERLIPNLLNKTAGEIESGPGTPVQAARNAPAPSNATPAVTPNLTPAPTSS
jgi:hypothetical protein